MATEGRAEVRGHAGRGRGGAQARPAGERASAGLRGVARGAHTLCRRAGEGREAGSRRERQGRGARVEWRRVGWVGKEDTWAFDGGAAAAGFPDCCTALALHEQSK
jgi:hypothetical protein